MLKAINIHKIFTHPSGKLHVLKGIDLSVEEGDCLAIVGPSGAGKSTLLHILGGLDRPNEGDVLFEGKNVFKLNEKQRSLLLNRDIGFIFQFYHLLPEMTAAENVMLPALVSNGSQSENARKESLKLLERVGLIKRAAHKPNELSGGEQQRVAIARALINKPKIIFCDEPTGNLDSQSGKDILGLLIEFNQHAKQTLVIVTHDDNIAKNCNKVINMKDGKFV